MNRSPWYEICTVRSTSKYLVCCTRMFFCFFFIPSVPSPYVYILVLSGSPSPSRLGLVGTGREWSISILHIGPDQPDPRPKPNPKGTRGRMGQGQARGSAACFGGVFPKKIPGGRKDSRDQDQHPAQSFVLTSPAHRASPEESMKTSNPAINTLLLIVIVNALALVEWKEEIESAIESRHVANLTFEI